LKKLIAVRAEEMRGDWVRLRYNMAAVFLPPVFTAKQEAVKREAVKICLGFLSRCFLLQMIKVFTNLKVAMK